MPTLAVETVLMSSETRQLSPFPTQLIQVKVDEHVRLG